MARYPNSADHGLIGDLQTAALVSTDGVLDWFCCPRFDSPSVFASLLDAERGGVPMYLPDTAVLISRFMTPDGVGEAHSLISAAINLDHQLDHPARHSRLGPGHRK